MQLPLLIHTSCLFLSCLHLKYVDAKNQSKTDLIVESCNVGVDATFPFNELDPLPVQLNVEFTVDRFVGIDDVQQTATVIGVISVIWESPCLRHMSQDWSEVDKNMDIPTSGLGFFWTPMILHRNAVDDMAMGGDGFFKSVTVSPITGLFGMIIAGKFTSYCNLNFYNFPFDHQICNVQLIVVQNPSLVHLESSQIVLNSDIDFESQNLIWKLTNYTSVNLGYDDSTADMDETILSLTVERQSSYYMINFFLPNVILGCLQLSSFLIPVEMADRPVFSCTVLLSVFIIQDHIIAVLPITPSFTLAFIYILISTIFAMSLTIYGGFMCSFLHYWPKQAKKRWQLLCFCLDRFRFKTYMVIDAFAFCLATLAFVFYNYHFFSSAILNVDF